MAITLCAQELLVKETVNKPKAQGCFVCALL